MKEKKVPPLNKSKPEPGSFQEEEQIELNWMISDQPGLIVSVWNDIQNNSLVEKGFDTNDISPKYVTRRGVEDR